MTRGPHLQNVHDKVKDEQKAGGKEKPIQKQTFDYTVRVGGGDQCLHQLVKTMTHRSCNKQPAINNKQGINSSGEHRYIYSLSRSSTINLKKFYI